MCPYHCPACNAVNPPNATTCRKCGGAIDFSAIRERVAKRKESEDKRRQKKLDELDL